MFHLINPCVMVVTNSPLLKYIHSLSIRNVLLCLASFFLLEIRFDSAFVPLIY